MSSIQICSILFSALIAITDAIPIDNGVEGDPEIECGSTAITVNFNTRNTFEGHVYAKGLYDNQDCRSDEGGRQVAGITLPFDTCNVARTRSLNPRGIFVTAVVVISFHPQFITKIDRSYRLQCFYMEADKTVSTKIEVSELTTAFATQSVPMPVCRYEILDGGPSEQPVQYAIVGQPVYHKWTCDSETVDTYCALIHSCFVDDGNGETIELLNEEGCALDKYLLNNLEYPTDLMAGQEAHVYKYADRSQLFYQCQITIAIKEPNGECVRPQCSEPQGFGATKRQTTRRASRKQRDTSAWNDPSSTLDVRTEINALEIMDANVSNVFKQIGNDILLSLKRNNNELMDFAPIRMAFSPAGLCFSNATFAAIIVMFGVLLCAVFIIIIYFFRLKQSTL
uniref:ZP domain-containing protein n=1 Tax=Elaeophora elaphi TaxID=1147741 RepID=A0A0R3RZN7_9BILA